MIPFYKFSGGTICKLPQYAGESSLSADAFHNMLLLALRVDLTGLIRTSVMISYYYSRLTVHVQNGLGTHQKPYYGETSWERMIELEVRA